jgi:hypothetical protein
MDGGGARMREMRNVYRILVGNPEKKVLVRRTMVRWEDDIKMKLK